MADPHADVVVTDAGQRQALVALRALGREGRTTCAVDSSADAPGFASRWTGSRALVPDFARDRDGYVDALLAVCAEHSPRALIPCHDGSIEAIRRRRSDVERVVGLALAGEDALASAVDKVVTLTVAETLGLRAHRGVVVTDPSAAIAAVEQIGLPAVVKPARSWLQDADTVGRRLTSVLATRREDAVRAIDAIVKGGTTALVQQWLPGDREALSFFTAQGRVWARFAQRADRTWPALGGNSVLRESIALPVDVAPAAERLVMELGLEGYCEVEFRRDAEGQAVLMEINPRLSASVEIAVRAGVGFPELLYAWAAGEPLREVTGYRTGIWMRWLAGDLSLLHRSLSGAPEPDVAPRMQALRAFVADFARPMGYDYVQAGDLRPALQATRGAASRARRRIAPTRSGADAVDTDVAVIGAGPYGLSLAAHLAGQGVRHEVFGDPMDAWRNHMPDGMRLKSEGFASNLSDPEAAYTLRRFCATFGIDYADLAAPIALDTFAGYGSWFQQQLVPGLRPDRVLRVRRDGGAFELTLSTGDALRARRVVVATGLTGYAHIPATLTALPLDRLSHAYDYSRPAGGDVVIIGAGQSALETAALEHEAGGTVRLVARAPRLAWNSKPGGRARPLRQRMRYPESGLGEGLAQWLYSNHPLAFRRLPYEQRLRRAYSVLGPAGSWWLRPRIEDQLETLLGHRVTAASAAGGGVRLRLDGPVGTRELSAGHVIAATGYRPDLARVAFLDPALLADVKCLAGAPVLNSAFESSVPRLHFVGYSAAISFGPVMRFVYGTEFAARRVAGHAATERDSCPDRAFAPSAPGLGRGRGVRRRRGAAGTVTARRPSGQGDHRRRPRVRLRHVRPRQLAAGVLAPLLGRQPVQPAVAGGPPRAAGFGGARRPAALLRAAAASHGRRRRDGSGRREADVLLRIHRPRVPRALHRALGQVPAGGPPRARSRRRRAGRGRRRPHDDHRPAHGLGRRPLARP
jgi:predicted ATP-grasp superfamily ATP-dependent carboligase